MALQDNHITHSNSNRQLPTNTKTPHITVSNKLATSPKSNMSPLPSNSNTKLEKSPEPNSKNITVAPKNEHHINPKNTSGNTLLYQTVIALTKGNATIEDVERLLTESPGDINKQSANNKLTALHVASQENNAETMALLIKYGADVNITNCLGYTALHMATDIRCTETVELLLENGADVNIKTHSGNTALLLAVQNNDIETVKLLLQYKADLNIAGQDQKTPLVVAKEKNYDAIADILKQHMINQDLAGQGQKTPSDNASGNHGKGPLATQIPDASNAKREESPEPNSKNITVAPKNEHHINPKNTSGNTLLYQTVIALRTNNATREDVERLLKQSPGDINKQSQTMKNTPLHVALDNRDIKTVKLLLAHGADVNQQNIDGKSALHIAVLDNDIETVKLLLQYKADLNIAGQQGKKTPLDVAKEKNYNEIADILTQHMINQDIAGQGQKTASQVAKANNYNEIAGILKQPMINQGEAQTSSPRFCEHK